MSTTHLLPARITGNDNFGVTVHGVYPGDSNVVISLLDRLPADPGKPRRASAGISPVAALTLARALTEAATTLLANRGLK